MSRRCRQPGWLWRLPILRRWRIYDVPADNVQLVTRDVAPGVVELVSLWIQPKMDAKGRLLDQEIWIRADEDFDPTMYWEG